MTVADRPRTYFAFARRATASKLTAEIWWHRTRWEFDRARDLLALVADEPGHAEDFLDRHEDDLRGAMIHAVRAWCRTHLRCKDASEADDNYYSAFAEKAPEDLYHTVTQTHAAIDRRRVGGFRQQSL